ncbi:MAG: beta-phosphoglucomutase [Candidatus Acidoferrum typicum]|nr:beta-phosphoglucomutase [Candidatus Acidoferrum typicum]
MFRGVVFDFDGVIVDSHPVHKRAWKKFLESIGKTVSESQLQFVLDGRKREDILRHFLGELDPEQVVEYGLRKEELFRDEAADVQTVEGFSDFLEDLQDAKVALGIASSASRSRLTFLLDRLELRRHFPVVVTADEVDQGKPNPAVFLKAARKLGICPSELLAFEDAVSGVKAARSSGMMCIGIAQADRASTLLAAGAISVVPNFCDLSYAKLRHFSSNGTVFRPLGTLI